MSAIKPSLFMSVVKLRASLGAVLWSLLEAAALPINLEPLPADLEGGERPYAERLSLSFLPLAVAAPPRFCDTKALGYSC